MYRPTALSQTYLHLITNFIISPINLITNFIISTINLITNFIISTINLITNFIISTINQSFSYSAIFLPKDPAAPGPYCLKQYRYTLYLPFLTCLFLPPLFISPVGISLSRHFPLFRYYSHPLLSGYRCAYITLYI